jgi:carbon starvation protein
MNVFAVTLIGLGLVVLSIYLGVQFPISLSFGDWNIPVWAFIAAIILYGAAVLPTPLFVQPTNYLAFYPAYAAIILLLVGALATPFTNIPVRMPAGPILFTADTGPLWPLLFVAIACGAISGWHSLVSSSSSSKQLDIETDALPVGGGAMLSEGLLALVSLIAYMVLAPGSFGQGNYPSWVEGAVLLTSPFLGALTGQVLTTFFGLVLIIYALTVQALVTRFFRLVAGETWSEGRFHVFGNKHVSTVVGLALPWGFAVSGSWWALWLYFGGSNQLLAGLAIMLITIHLARTRAPTKYSLIPAVFMIVTTLSALVWQTYTFANSVLQYLSGTPYPFGTRSDPFIWISRNVRQPIDRGMFASSPWSLIPLGINALFVFIGVILFVVGLSMAIRLFRSYRSSMIEARAKAPAAADGGTREK